MKVLSLADFLIIPIKGIVFCSCGKTACVRAGKPKSMKEMCERCACEWAEQVKQQVGGSWNEVEYDANRSCA